MFGVGRKVQRVVEVYFIGVVEIWNVSKKWIKRGGDQENKILFFGMIDGLCISKERM